ncbi:MAG: hypothetical protein COA52_00510 [Hyphomicrobiales bacterium]|nr:MAG: hypothetical protein COA52_00510 [Hyphomicrobiales bacterium]
MILVDYSQIGMAAYFAAAGKNSDLDLEYFRYIVLNSLRAINVKFRKKYGDIVICCDGTNSWRKDMFQYYKGKRRKDRAKDKILWRTIFEYMGVVKEELKNDFHWTVIDIPKIEGDDVIATLAFNNIKDYHMVVSSDKDFIQLQCYSDKIQQYNNKDNKHVIHNNPKEYLFEHIMRGDSADGIPNILSDDDTFMVEGKRQKVISAKKMATWKEMFIIDILDDEDENIKKELIKKYNRNKKLIDLRHIPDEYIEMILSEFSTTHGREYKSLRKYFMDIGLTQLIEKMKDFK